MLVLFIPAIIILTLSVLLWVLTKIEIRYDRKSEFDRKMKPLNLSVVNTHITDIIDSMNFEDYVYWVDSDVRKGFMRYFSSLLYDRKYTKFEKPSNISVKYYTFLSEGLEGTIDNVSTVYLPMLLKLREEVAQKRFMSDEDLSEYNDREQKLIEVIEDEINKNFENVRVMKHSKNQNTLSEADYVIKNGGIR